MLKPYDSDPPCGTNIATLTYRQIPDLLELQRKATASLPEAMVQCDDAAFYAGLLEGRGRILGLFDGGVLLACSVISWPSPGSPENLGADVNLNGKQLAQVANLESAYVLPAVQGRGMAKILSGMQLDHATGIGMRHALSTASPLNLYSVKNLFSMGFRIRNIALKYSNKLRYVLYRNLLANDSRSDRPNSKGVWIPSLDLAAQKDLLAEGYEGINSKGTKENFSILYAKKRERGYL